MAGNDLVLEYAAPSHLHATVCHCVLSILLSVQIMCSTWCRSIGGLVATGAGLSFIQIAFD